MYSILFRIDIYIAMQIRRQAGYGFVYAHSSPVPEPSVLPAFYLVLVFSPPLLCEFCSCSYLFGSSRATLLSAIFVMLNVKKIIRQSLNPANNIGYYCVTRFILCKLFFQIVLIFARQFIICSLCHAMC